MVETDDIEKEKLEQFKSECDVETKRVDGLPQGVGGPPVVSVVHRRTNLGFQMVCRDMVPSAKEVDVVVGAVMRKVLNEDAP